MSGSDRIADALRICRAPFGMDVREEKEAEIRSAVLACALHGYLINYYIINRRIFPRRLFKDSLIHVKEERFCETPQNIEKGKPCNDR
jgi:hypothetical protein